MNTWPHFDDLPFEIVIEQIDESGNVVQQELIGRSNVASEARHRCRNASVAIVDQKQFRAVLRKAPFESIPERPEPTIGTPLQEEVGEIPESGEEQKKVPEDS